PDFDKALAADRGLDGEIAQDRTAYEHALTELQEFALEAREWFTRAKDLIKGINEAPKLTPAEKQRIKRTDIVNAGKGGAGFEDARDKARDAFEAQQLE